MHCLGKTYIVWSAGQQNWSMASTYRSWSTYIWKNFEDSIRNFEPDLEDTANIYIHIFKICLYAVDILREQCTMFHQNVCYINSLPRYRSIWLSKVFHQKCIRTVSIQLCDCHPLMVLGWFSIATRKEPLSWYESLTIPRLICVLENLRWSGKNTDQFWSRMKSFNLF